MEVNLTERSKSLLVIDDEDSICLGFKRFFGERGWRVAAAASAEAGLSAYRELEPTVVFLDVRLPDRSGLSLLYQLTGERSNVVIITAYGGLDTIVQAIRGKAYDYLAKPLDLDQALALADRIWESHRPGGSSAPATSRETKDVLIGKSPLMQIVYKLIARAAESSSPVLIEGETGTGKELVARAIHRLSARHAGPFVALNCGAIPENLIESELFGHVRGAFTGAEKDRPGRFELADQGCLLLDEIGDLPLAVQVKLLRVLDDGIVERVGSAQPIRLNVRVLAVTNKDLDEEIRRGRFRPDLYYRLHVLRISLPPLRERKEDMDALAAHFLASPASTTPPPVLAPDAREVLMAHNWPGNVRELRNAIEHAAAMAPRRTIHAVDLPRSIQTHLPANQTLEESLSNAVIEFAVGIQDAQGARSHRALEHAERALIAYAMKRFQGNQSDAADYLGLHRNTMRNKLRDLNIELNEPLP